jgi:thiamine-phosphate pyrophosphorylase
MMKFRHKKHGRTAQLPRIWLMTDPRFGDGLLRAVQRLPYGSGVIFRHYQMEPAARRTLFREVRAICHRRGHMLLLAGDVQTAAAWGADGAHGRGISQSKMLIRSMPVHNIREIIAAKQSRPDMVLLSPLFSTASHPGARVLGMMRFMQLAKLLGDTRVIALGGMSRAKGNMLCSDTIHGWAAIDAFR